MKNSTFEDLLIRTAVVRRLDLGFIYACDKKKEQEDITHTIIYKWKAGVFSHVECNYNAHTACLIENPEIGLLNLSEQGYFTLETGSGVTGGEILDTSQPPPKKRRLGGFRSVSEIGGQAYAVGLRGMVYRLDKLAQWTRIDDGLPEDFNIQAIDGFDASNIYAVGRNGDLWHYHGKGWTKRDLPTNINLTSIKCA